MTRSRLTSWCGASGFCRETLEALYAAYNRREFVHPDPLEFVLEYSHPLDREVVGLVAASLAYGRVRQILKSVAQVLRLMGGVPSQFVREHSHGELQEAFKEFRHRFTGGGQLAGLLYGIGRVMARYGSLESCFRKHCRPESDTFLPALTAFVAELRAEIPCAVDMLVPRPEKGSACKRLNLFLRWMVRHDEVDPGGWHRLDPCRLIVPLDTHMHRLGLEAGLTCRRQGDMRTALEVTRAFRAIAPDDPVRYDFALTRLGIRGIEDEPDSAMSGS